MPDRARHDGGGADAEELEFKRRLSCFDGIGDDGITVGKHSMSHYGVLTVRYLKDEYVTCALRYWAQGVRTRTRCL